MDAWTNATTLFTVYIIEILYIFLGRGNPDDNNMHDVCLSGDQVFLQQGARWHHYCSCDIICVNLVEAISVKASSTLILWRLLYSLLNSGMFTSSVNSGPTIMKKVITANIKGPAGVSLVVPTRLL